MKRPSIPVIMYHTVGIPNDMWHWNYLTCPYKTFESQLKWLKKMNFCTISLQELYNYMNTGIDLPKNSLILTFDDGFLDNWIFAYPLLKKYGFKGTIYVNPEFVENTSNIRNNLDDVWKGNIGINELQKTGYLSWQELKLMEDTGIMEIQSHSMTHTWYPLNNRIVDFRHPNDTYIWMTWNNNPNEKPYLHLDKENLIDYGEPVYEHGRAIGIKRFFPDKKLSNYLVDYVQNHGGKNFFICDGWREKLHGVTKQFINENELNEKYETEDEYKKRLYYEIGCSKKILESKLNKKIKFLCWPGGAVNDMALDIAMEVGYLSSTVGKDMSQNRRHLSNIYGESPVRINRIDAILYWDGIEGSESKIKYKSGFPFILSLYLFQKRMFFSSFSKLVLFSMCFYYQIRYKLINRKGRE